MIEYRLTPDITIRGRMPTPLEYREHMRLLADVGRAVAASSITGSAKT